MKNAKNSSSNSNRGGFTLAELIVALMISSIITLAVVSLAFAMSSADDTSDDTSQKQAQLRYTTLTISDLLRHCKLICSKEGNNLAVWRADDDDDGQIDPTELVYIESGAGTYLRLVEFASGTASISLDGILSGTVRPALNASDSPRQSDLIPQCSNVSIGVDVAPPWTRHVSISFDMVENETTRHYEMEITLMAWAGNLLDAGGNIVSDDD